jgi:hypothetical protein
MPEPKREPIKLQMNRRYPTFQLFAEISNRQIPSGVALKICVLEIIGWLRKRFSAFGVNMPEDLLLPEPEDFESFNDDDIKSLPNHL